jgi:ABC-type phosphate/phosphonate transport system substrate-binding protein
MLQTAVQEFNFRYYLNHLFSTILPDAALHPLKTNHHALQARFLLKNEHSPYLFPYELPMTGNILKQHTRSCLKLCCCLMLCCLFLLPATCLEAAARPDHTPVHRIGVLAKRGSRATVLKWKATADYLTSQIPGHAFTIIPLSFTEISDAVKQKKIEFFLANPIVFSSLSAKNGVRPLATLENLRGETGYSVFGGVIFTRADSAVRDYSDLEHASFAAVSKNSLGGWLTAWRELKKQHITPAGSMENVAFLGTHDDVVFAVRDKRFTAGTVRTDTLERMQKEGKIQLKDFRIISRPTYSPTQDFPFLRSTELYPEWPFSTTKSTAEQLSKKVTVALLKMAPDSTAARASSINGWDVVRNYQPVHELEKELRLGSYQKINYLTFKDVLARYNLLIKAGIITFIFNAFLVYYLFRLKRILRSDIQRRQKIERILKTTNRRYYDDMMRHVYDDE